MQVLKARLNKQKQLLKIQSNKHKMRLKQHQIREKKQKKAETADAKKKELMLKKEKSARDKGMLMIKENKEKYSETNERI